jgi:hypothetical protein
VLARFLNVKRSGFKMLAEYKETDFEAAEEIKKKQTLFNELKDTLSVSK